MPNDQVSNLLDLIGFRLTIAGLEIQNLRHPIAGKDMVIATNPLSESQVDQKGAKVAKADIRVRVPSKDSVERLRDFTHSGKTPVLSYLIEVARSKFRC